MIIDFHTHTFPDKHAEVILKNLAQDWLPTFTDGTASGLLTSMTENGISLSVVLPVVTKPSQTASINHAAILLNEQSCGLLSFGGIHPANDNYKELINELASNHVPGLKIHPAFVQTHIDDTRFLHIIDYACEKGLLVSIHTGDDVTYPGIDFASPQRLCSVMQKTDPEQFILAHMGGWLIWDQVAEMLEEFPCYIDTSFCLPSDQPQENATGLKLMTKERFCHLLNLVGVGRVLFGTDSPWTGQASSLRSLRSLGLPESDLQKILSDNARRLLSV